MTGRTEAHEREVAEVARACRTAAAELLAHLCPATGCGRKPGHKGYHTPHRRAKRPVAPRTRGPDCSTPGCSTEAHRQGRCRRCMRAVARGEVPSALRRRAPPGLGRTARLVVLVSPLELEALRAHAAATRQLPSDLVRERLAPLLEAR